MKQSHLVEIAPGMRFECLAEESLGIQAGDEVIVNFEKHQDWGKVLRLLGMVPEADQGVTEGERKASKGTTDSNSQRDSGSNRQRQEDIPPEILRRMTEADQVKIADIEARAESMFRTAHRKIREHHLAMKLVGCHYAFDKSIAFFQFSAEGRVDFRNLVRDLSGALHTRVELRQIGVRDEAGIVGGIGPCGRVFCCASVLSRFHSVNVKMAKIQRLSLNPASVSGGCGRLKCCLRYEVDGYREMCRNLPRSGSRCMTPDGPGRVMDCNALTQRVRIRLESDAAQFKDYNVDEVSQIPRDGGGKGQESGQTPRGESTRTPGSDSRGSRRGEDTEKASEKTRTQSGPGKPEDRQRSGRNKRGGRGRGANRGSGT